MIEKFKQEYRLWEKCFGDSEEYMDYYFSEKTKDNKILRIFKEDELVSMVHLNPYPIYWKGKNYPLYYIVGVCTDENHRKKGYMRKLLKEAFKLMEQENCPFTYLMPAKKEIYEPFDFHFIYTQKRLQGRLSAAGRSVRKAQKKTRLKAVPFSLLSPKQKEKTAEFQNNSLSAAFDLYAVRTLAYLERLSLEMRAAGGDFLVMLEPEEKQMEETEPEGNICGTVAYMAEQGKGEAKSVCEVAEAVLRLEDSQTVMELLAEELVRKAAADWEIHFLETGFWDKRVLSGFLEDAIAFEKPIIMAKIIEAGKEDELLEELRSARVYLNEIV